MLYGIDLYDLVVNIKMQKQMLTDKIYKPVIVIAYDNYDNKFYIIKQLKQMFGEFNTRRGNYYHINDEIEVDLRYVGTPKDTSLVAGHCDILIYCYTTLNTQVLPELLPILFKNGQFLTVCVDRMITNNFEEFDALIDNIKQKEVILNMIRSKQNGKY